MVKSLIDRGFYIIPLKIFYFVSYVVSFFLQKLDSVVKIDLMTESMFIQLFIEHENENYLGCLELVSEFDSFLSEHLKKYGNKEKEIFHIYLPIFAINLLQLWGDKC